MAKMSTLIDPFTGTSLNGALWGSTVAGGAATSYSSSGASINLPSSSTSSTYGDVASLTTYDLTNSSAYVQVTAVNAPATAANANLYLAGNVAEYPNTQVGWNYSSGTLNAFYNPGTGQTTLFTTTYSATTHAWWRIREASGTVYWDTAPDGIVWTNRASVADPFTLTALYALFVDNCFENETNPGSFTWSLFNVSPFTPSLGQYAGGSVTAPTAGGSVK